MVVGSGEIVSGKATLLITNSGTQLHAWPHDGEVRSVAFSPDGLFVLTSTGQWGNEPGHAQMFEVSSGEVMKSWPHDHDVNAVAFSPDSLFVITGSGGLYWKWI